MSIVVVRAGLLTSVQDTGATGHARFGVPLRGALDAVSLRLANMLVGNEQRAADLEIMLDGPHLRFDRAARIAICGADLAATADGVELPMWRPIDLGAGVVVRFASARRGARAYLAVRGGIDVPLVLGSRSTHLGAGFGGFDGRALHAGDRLEIGSIVEPDVDAGTIEPAQWSIAHELRTPLDGAHAIRVIACGRDDLEREGMRRLVDGDHTVSAASDRMGMRFDEPLLPHDRSITSEPAMIGAVQMPPDGRPIVLLAEHQTTGGYPVIAYVATVDLPALAQVRPGGRVRFAEIDVETAQRLLHERERELGRLRRWIELST